MKKIYIITGNDEWLTHVLINRLLPLYQVVLIKVKSNSFDFLKQIKIIILIGLIDFLKILVIQYKKKDYKIIKTEKNFLNNYLKKINKNKIFLINYPYKINGNFKNIYNCHPSLLPNYKGLLPIQRNMFDRLFNHKKINFGLTIHKLEENFDSGKIIWNKSIKLNLKKDNKFKKIYERIYENFFYGINQIYSKKKIRYVKTKNEKNSKLSISFFEILLLKMKIL